LLTDNFLSCKKERKEKKKNNKKTNKKTTKKIMSSKDKED